MKRLIKLRLETVIRKYRTPISTLGAIRVMKLVRETTAQLVDTFTILITVCSIFCVLSIFPMLVVNRTKERITLRLVQSLQGQGRMA